MNSSMNSTNHANMQALVSMTVVFLGPEGLDSPGVRSMAKGTFSADSAIAFCPLVNIVVHMGVSEQTPAHTDIGHASVGTCGLVWGPD